MPVTLYTSAAPRRRCRSIVATFALVGALFAAGGAASASADVVGAVSGTATDGNGQPLAGVSINASITSSGGGLSWGSTLTDEAGNYQLANLPLGYTFQISAFLGGHPSPPMQNVALTAEAPTGTANFVILQYPTGAGTISGHVTVDGVPLAGFEVSLTNQTTYQNPYMLTDANGFYQFTGLANGTWTATGATGPNDYQPIFPESVVLSDASNSAVIDFPYLTWPVGTASIHGVVTDSATNQAISSVSVGLYGTDVPHNSYQSTDATGSFVFDLLPAGTYFLSFNAVGYLPTNQEIVVVSGQALTEDRALIPTNATISGHVKARNGAPAIGIYVDAHNADGNFGGATTDDSGNYVISDIGAVTYTLTIGGTGTPFTQKTKTVTAIANANVTANFTLENRKTGSLSGIANGPGGEYYTAPVCVTLYSSKSKKALAEVPTYGPNYGDGTYTFFDVKPGTYTVKFEDCDSDPALKFDPVYLGGVKNYKDATFVTIAAAQDSYGNDINLKFRAAHSSITGHIAKSNGTPIVGLPVHATDGAGISGDAVTNATGDYTIAGLWTGNYTVSVGGAPTLYDHKEKTVTTIEDGSVTANFTLAKR